MEFRLLYDGPVKATQRDPRPGTNQRARHWELKHEMRQCFSDQLQYVWKETPFIAHNQTPKGTKGYHIERLSERYRIPPWSFVPLVTEELQLLCGVDILFLRMDHPADSVWGGDIDNRIKTVIDSLRVPNAQSGYADIVPDKDHNPLYCLLEDDKLLTKVSVETGKLLKCPDGADQSYASLVISVTIRPENLIFGNMGF